MRGIIWEFVGQSWKHVKIMAKWVKGVFISPRRFKLKVYTTDITISLNNNLTNETILHSTKKGEWRKEQGRERLRTSW